VAPLTQAAQMTAAETTFRCLEDSIRQIAQLPPGDTEVAPFNALHHSVIHASSGCVLAPEVLLGPLEPKEPVLRYLVDLHEAKKMYRKQIVAVAAMLLQVPSWAQTLRSNEQLCNRLPEALRALVEEQSGSGSSSRSSSLLLAEAGGPPGTETHLCIRLTTYVLFVVFGTGSWLTVNGLFTELPLLVVHLPEGWRLASVLAPAVQLANVGPILFCLTDWWWTLRHPVGRSPWRSQSDRFASWATYTVLAIGAVAMAALACCWQVTVKVAGSQHSVALIALAFVAALADCTSSVLFWRFAGAFHPVYLSALAAGEGMSGVVTSVLVWLQGVSQKEPQFSVGSYFALLAVAMFIAMLAFHILRRAPFLQTERRLDETATQCHEGCELPAARFLESSSCDAPVDRSNLMASNRVAEDSSGESIRWTREIVALLLLQAWMNVLQNGVWVSCLSLAAKPYGRAVLEHAQTFSLCVDPLAAALGYKIKLGSTRLLPVAVCLTALYSYILALSLDAVVPPFLPSEGGGGAGGVLLVAMAGLTRALTAYTKMRGSVLLQGTVPIRSCGRLLTLLGAAMQTGAFVGTAVMTLLINGTALFRSKD